MMELTLLSAFLIGLLGSSHCVLMCGGLCAAVIDSRKKNNVRYLLSYNLGRVISYGLLGMILGIFGMFLVDAAPMLAVIFRAIAGLLLIAMGLYLSQWWMGLTYLEKLGAKIFAWVQPLTGLLLPIKSHHQALSLGLLWGLLPCGLVYSTLAWSLAAADWRQSSLFMVAFGVGTLPAMLLLGFSQKKILYFLFQKKFRGFAGLVIIVLGALTFYMPWLHLESSHQMTGSHH